MGNVMMLHTRWWLAAALAVVFSFVGTPALAAVGGISLTDSTVGGIALTIFVLAYVLVIAEEKLHMRKSKPVLVAAGLIWGMIGYVYVGEGMSKQSEDAFRHTLLEFSELMLFLLVAMTYINAMEERRVFDALRSWLIRKGF